MVIDHPKWGMKFSQLGLQKPCYCLLLLAGFYCLATEGTHFLLCSLFCVYVCKRMLQFAFFFCQIVSFANASCGVRVGAQWIALLASFRYGESLIPTPSSVHVPTGASRQ